MSTMQQIEAEQELALSNEEQIRRWRAATSEVFPGIFKTPGVCGGDACVGSTRITVGGLVEQRQLGCDDAKLLDAYPHLCQQHLDNAWEYARTHAEEIEKQIAENNRED